MDDPAPHLWNKRPPPPGPWDDGGAEPPPGWAPPPPLAPVAAAPAPVQYVAVKTNGMAIAALVLGLIWPYTSILAVILGHIAKRQIDRSGGLQSGRGMAIAGIVLGWVGVVAIVAILAVVIFVPDTTTTYDPYEY